MTDPRELREHLPVASLGVAAVTLLGAGVLLRGREAAWAFPHSETSLVSNLMLSVVVAAGLAAALYAWEGLHRRWSPPAARVAGVLAVMGMLTLLFWFTAPDNYLGDWKTLADVTGSGRTNGKWWGLGLLYGRFHQLVGEPLDLRPLESAALLSCVSGALNAWLYVLVARHVGLTRAFGGWPWLYVGTFGLVGLGLGHLEIYGPVVSVVAAVLLAGLEVLEKVTVVRVIAFGIFSGIAMAAYLGSILLVPLIAGLVAFVLFVAARERRPRLALAGAAVVLVCVLPVVLSAVPSDLVVGRTLADYWTQQFVGSAAGGGDVPVASFLPEDVHWSLARNLLSPKYWLAGWHVSDMLQQFLVDMWIPLWVVFLSGGGLALEWWRRRKWRAVDPQLVWLSAASLVFLAWAWLVVGGLPYPVDWSMRSVAACPVLFLAAKVLAGALRDREAPTAKLAHGFAVLGALFALGQGWVFLDGSLERPAAFGPPSTGLRLAVTPEVLELRQGEAGYVRLWYENTGRVPFHLDATHIEYELRAVSTRHFLLQKTQKRPFRGQRHLEPSAHGVLYDFPYRPRRVLRSPPTFGGEPDWSPLEGPLPEGRYVASLIVRLWLPRAGARIELQSADFEILVTGAR